MSSGQRETVSQGTNSQGNDYTSYSDGAYYYSNKGESGQTTSTHYDTGRGHAFHHNNGGEGSPGYSYHENQNQGYRTYSSKK